MFPIILQRDQYFFHGEIQAVELSELYLHEETINSSLRDMINYFKRVKVYRDPIIVDSNSFVVLDGMHRVSALKSLDYDFIIAYLVDYQSELIRIEKWIRKFNLKQPLSHSILDKILSILKKENVEISMYSDKEICDDMLEKREILAYMITPSIKKYICFLNHSRMSIMEIYTKLRRIEKIIISKFQASVSYIPKKYLTNKNKEEAIYIVPPAVLKNEVIYYARKKQLFPPKTTRHIIPLRPFFVNVPLRLLRKDNVISSASTLNSILRVLLLQKNGVKLQGKVIMDRLYEEDYIYVFF